MKIKQLIEADEKAKPAEKKVPKEMIALITEAEKKMKKVEAALASLRETTIKLPALFRSEITSGRVHNLDTPKEYQIWVGVENLKTMYGLSKEVKESAEYLPIFKQRLKDYKK